ncbi:MAG: class I SAM-dependent methyltransferase [Clostridia bacterium]|nr:class I SAM-dependent methyltransferase [Clostridia bacterium]
MSGKIAEQAWEILEGVRRRSVSPYVPVVRSDSLKILLDTAASIAPSRILEIGTAVGYSSSLLALMCEGAIVDTVDIDADRMDLARQLWTTLGVDGRICSYLGDVREVIDEIIEGKRYELVFMDGPKSAYLPLLKKILPHMSAGGAIVSDNVGYLNLVKGDAYPPHKHRTIVRNMRQYLEYVQGNGMDTAIYYELGDGIAVSRIL